MTHPTNVWALILAGGEGSRLRTLTTTPCGTAVPKQFCSLAGGHTLIEDAAVRARGVVEPHRICTIVAQQHRQWWSDLLEGQPSDNVIVQPRNRGTGIGILYSALHIVARDPQARILLLPADHYVRDEYVLRQSLRSALNQTLRNVDSSPVLLGLEPEFPDTELGYIVPGGRDASGLLTVRRFIEKPQVAVANEIIDAGALWNTFIIAASASSLINMFMRRYASLALEMQMVVGRTLNAASAGAGWPALVDLYDRLPSIDFSSDLLEGQENFLRVEPVPACGWSDLGTPRRVAETLQGLGSVHSLHEERATRFVNLAAQHAAMQRQMKYAATQRSSASG